MKQLHLADGIALFGDFMNSCVNLEQETLYLNGRRRGTPNIDVLEALQASVVLAETCLTSQE